MILGDAGFLRARHADGALATPRDEHGWFLRLAVDCARPEILKLLLDLGLDPDARVRVDGVDEIAFTWGMPLYQCACFRMILERCGPPTARLRFGTTILHEVVTMGDHVTAMERVAFATAALNAGARVDVRDDLLKSTPLGWACRWGRLELVKVLLERGADPVEADAESWATPLAWAEKKGHHDVVAILRERQRPAS